MFPNNAIVIINQIFSYIVKMASFSLFLNNAIVITNQIFSYVVKTASFSLLLNNAIAIIYYLLIINLYYVIMYKYISQVFF